RDDPWNVPVHVSWFPFETHRSVVLGILALAALYVLGARRRGAPRLAPGRAATFAGGLAVLFLALNGPLHDLSDNYLFSAHMAQHLLLTLIMPPLLLVGTPGWMLSPLVRVRLVRAALATLTWPLVAFR